MELPAYHWPRPVDVLRSVWERASHFLKKAGTIITLATITIWFLQGFGIENGSFGMVQNINNSILAAIGGAIAFIFKPLGWGTWKPVVATVTGLIAKENVVGTFGILYHAASEAEAGSAHLWARVAQSYTPITAYSFLAFNLLCAPCFAAIGAIRTEMNSGKWTARAIGYECLLAYCVALCINQIGGLIAGEHGFGIGPAVAIVIIIGFVYLLVRPDPNKKLLDAARAQDVSIG
jgi:ferrous iron transport protein B